MENNLLKEEWINGNVMMSPRPEHNHMEIMRVVGRSLEDYFKGKCKVAIEESLFLTKDTPSDIKKDLVKLKALISAKKAELVPDIAVYCDKEQVFRRGYLGIPQMVVEVLSPSNSTDDTETKKEIYRKFGISEYWIISPNVKKVYVYSLKNDNYKLSGEYKFLEEKIISSRFEDLVIDVKDIELYEDDENSLW
jgi:Uma2 family endonuclease